MSFRHKNLNAFPFFDLLGPDSRSYACQYFRQHWVLQSELYRRCFEKYKSLGNGFKVTVAEQGARGLFLGWAPTLIGYSMQGLCKFGFYEFFKNTYSNMLGEENTYLYKTSLYLAASASAEFFADIALSPMEAVKVK